jgi:hypothetical protein
MLFEEGRLIQMCTSFAAYFGRPLYGMNFDFRERDIQFRIETYRGISSLLVSFAEEGEYLYIAGMNENGVFFNFQIEESAADMSDLKPNNNIEIGTLFEKAMSSSKDLGSICEIIQSNTVKVEGSLNLHSLLADKQGNAFILETDGYKNYICKNPEKFIVMTNFPNRELADKPLHQVCGAGTDRYKLACSYIRDNKESFNMEHAFKILKMAAQSKEHCKTICSMVFLPDTNEMYFTLNNDDSKMWKISIKNMVLESYRGSKDAVKLMLNSEKGVLSSELLSLLLHKA